MDFPVKRSRVKMKNAAFSVAILSLLVLSACSSNLQENSLAVPVPVGRDVVSVAVLGKPPTEKSILQSSVISVFKYSSPDSEEFIPVTSYKRGSHWFASGYAPAKTLEECEGFLKGWSEKLDNNIFRLGFCAKRHPEAPGIRSIADVTRILLS